MDCRTRGPARGPVRGPARGRIPARTGMAGCERCACPAPSSRPLPRARATDRIQTQPALRLLPPGRRDDPARALPAGATGAGVLNVLGLAFGNTPTAAAPVLPFAIGAASHRRRGPTFSWRFERRVSRRFRSRHAKRLTSGRPTLQSPRSPPSLRFSPTRDNRRHDAALRTTTSAAADQRHSLVPYAARQPDFRYVEGGQESARRKRRDLPLLSFRVGQTRRRRLGRRISFLYLSRLRVVLGHLQFGVVRRLQIRALHLSRYLVCWLSFCRVRIQ